MAEKKSVNLLPFSHEWKQWSYRARWNELSFYGCCRRRIREHMCCVRKLGLNTELILLSWRLAWHILGNEQKYIVFDVVERLGCQFGC
jgi:hypothetical protein